MALNKLPEEFSQRIKDQLGEAGWAEFLSMQTEVPWGGLRFNTLKGSVADLQGLLPFTVTPVEWAADGFYYPAQQRPAKLPFYQAGLYYLQEPSAMSSAALLGVRPGERVLDLCAAPGGKSTQIAAALQGQGLLVSNDNNAKRVKALVWNLEHWGATNYLVLQEEPVKLAPAFEEFFDKILVDAPCSGEGMFRKDTKALSGWQCFNGQVCRKMQDDILQQAARMLRPGGSLLYSTCTFNPLENEETIAAFLDAHRDFSLCELPLYEGWLPGKQLAATRQLWPHLVRGEGHFVALMIKGQGSTEETAKTMKVKAGRGGREGQAMLLPQLQPFEAFMAENLSEPLIGPFAMYQQHVYKVYDDLPDLAGLKVAKPGWYLGMIKGNRFEPSQAMAMGLSAKQVLRRLDLSPQDPLIERYLKGETLMVEGPKGWTLVTLSGYPLGFAKQTGDYLKNYYPPGWRKTDS
jgi:16S rRNA C967 or C1407 C5-methylase (RsmB/RsmF family)/NOL1/NOP2/fmu family ribosome biogenesis protein